MPKRRNLSVAFLYDDTLDSSDGVAQYVKTLGSWLQKRGHVVSYLVGETGFLRQEGGKVYSLSKNLKIKWAGNKLSIPIFPKRRKITELMKSENFDVIHVQVPFSPLMSQLVINRTKPDTAVVGTIHVFPSGWLSAIGSKLLKLAYGRSLRRFDLMLSVSGAANSYAKKAFGVNTKIAPNVVDLKAFDRASPKATKPEKTIVFLGRLVKRKGCENLIMAFRLVSRELPDARLLIAGDGAQRKKLEKLTVSLGINSSTEFLGRVSETQKAKLLGSADLACFPSLYGESFGIVLIEAMAAGSKVILGGDNPGYRSVLGDREELLVDPRDEEQLASRIIKLLSDEKRADEHYMWQKKQSKKYDIESVGPRIERYYRQAIDIRTKSLHN